MIGWLEETKVDLEVENIEIFSCPILCQYWDLRTIVGIHAGRLKEVGGPGSHKHNFIPFLAKVRIGQHKNLRIIPGNNGPYIAGS